MRPDLGYRHVYRAFLFLSFSIGAHSIAYGQSGASTPDTSVDAAMQAVRDYGHGHQASAVPLPSSVPVESETLYDSHVLKLLLHGDFAQLEKIARKNRTEKGRLIGGAWKVSTFYGGASSPHDSQEVKDSDFHVVMERLNQWIAAYPDSPAPRIALAYLYINYAWFARGPGFAQTVSDFQWELFNKRVTQARDQLLLAAKMKDRDPAWFEVMQLVAKAQGWDRTHARELLDRAVAFEPTYYHFYRRYADYLQPQWYGEQGDIKDLAGEASARLPEPDGSILYFQIASTLACYCRQHMEALPAVSYSKVKDGYRNLSRIYGTSNRIANRFAFMAYAVDDKAGTLEGLKAVSEMDKGIWYSTEVYNYAREWSAAP